MYIAPVALELELSSIDVTAGKSIDLNSAFIARLKLSDNKYINVTPTWILNFSSQGTLTNGLYTPAITQTYDRIYAFYTYNGLTQSSHIDINIQKDDTLLYISPDSINLNADETYDLRTVQAILEYMDGEQISVIPSWRILQGGGTIVNQIYTAPHTLAGEIILEAYHANISPTSYAKLHINKVEVSNAMNITSDNFTYSTAKYALVNANALENGAKWKAKNGFVTLTKQDFKDAMIAVNTHVDSCFETEANKLALIDAATTMAELLIIDLAI